MGTYKKIKAMANAKLNLELDVLNKRDDGYHNISSIFQSVSLADEIIVEVDTGNNIEVITSGAVIEGENLVKKAAELFLSEIERTANIKITLKKQIPLSAGLGGGSADAAAVLTCLNRSFGDIFPTSKLLDLSLNLGADVPFCLLGGTYLAEGIGENLTPLPYVGDYDVVLIKHHKKSSTGEMYSRIDNLPIPKISQNSSIQNKIKSGLHNEQPAISHNSFLYASNDRVEQEEICNLLIQNGAFLAGLSGSGPTVFGLFKDLNKNLISTLKQAYSEVWLCKTAPNGIEIFE